MTITKESLEPVLHNKKVLEALDTLEVELEGWCRQQEEKREEEHVGRTLQAKRTSE